jgi:hypothetical protein
MFWTKNGTINVGVGNYVSTVINAIGIEVVILGS